MPELPEVETIKNQLKEKIIGKTIKGIEVKLGKMIKGLTSQEFISRVRGTKVKDVIRRAKLLIIHLENGDSLVIHLKLTGQIIYKDKKENISAPGEEQKYTHLIYYFSDGSILLHNDLRQFGFVKLIRTPDLEDFFKKEKFGPEPLEKNFSAFKFKELLRKKEKQKIKPLLMDQSFIAGVGNVYANETCFCAGVLPTKTVKNLTDEKIEKIYHCLINILREAIKYKGTSTDSYVDVYGRKGEYLSKLKVYGHEGEKCRGCQGRVKRIALGGRGTFYCPNCQK